MIRLALTSVNSPWAFELRPGLNKLGRNPTNDFRLSDPSVSSFHAEISVNGPEIVVRDLGSTNGTYVDDRKIDESPLKPGNILRLGDLGFKLEEVTVIENVVPAKKPAPETKTEARACVYHADTTAAWACENCGGHFCELCVKVVGRARSGLLTLCPVCNGQCNHLPPSKQEQRKEPILKRLTQTLKIPFVR